MRHTGSFRLGVLLAFCLFSLFPFNGFAQVGIGTTDPKTNLDVAGALSLREGTALSLGNVNSNISLGTTPYSFYRIIGPTGAFNITGIVPTTGADGQLLTLENTTAHAMTIVHDATSMAANRMYCPDSQNLILEGQYSSVTLQYNINQSRWTVISYSASIPSIDSVTLAADQAVSAASYTDIPGMSVTFKAQKSEVLVMLTASGHGYTNSMSFIDLRVRNQTLGTTVGGTRNKIQSIHNQGLGTYNITVWSCSFSKLITGLTVGTTYTLGVQGRVQGILGTHTAVIYPATEPNGEHLTLSVIQ
ncbi:MAG: hypothetical protein Q8O62_10680 [Aequorivita sp.]|nr:hypothetical protein [Aequorivita sp.]